MAFNVTYHDLLDKNIRNIYGGLPVPMRWRSCQPVKVKVVEETTRIREEQVKPPSPLELRLREYLPNHCIAIPRAPAFRRVHQSELTEIMSRVTRPTSRTRRPHTVCSRELQRHEEDSCRKCVMHSSQSSRPKSRQELDVITARLLRPTTVSILRSAQRAAQRDGPTFPLLNE